jgi:hypothetical protein
MYLESWLFPVDLNFSGSRKKVDPGKGRWISLVVIFLSGYVSTEFPLQKQNKLSGKLFSRLCC